MVNKKNKFIVNGRGQEPQHGSKLKGIKSFNKSAIESRTISTNKQSKTKRWQAEQDKKN